MDGLFVTDTSELGEGSVVLPRTEPDVEPIAVLPTAQERREVGDRYRDRQAALVEADRLNDDGAVEL
jgi:hypothetical protein